MIFTGLLVSNFEPFISEWDVRCTPCECEQGYFVPLGWESELNNRNIAFEVRNDLSIKEIEM